MFRRMINYLHYVVKYRGRNIKFQFPVFIAPGSILEGGNRIGANCSISGSVGRGTYICRDCRLEADIGRYCSIAFDVQTVCGRHPLEKFVSTHPAFFSTKKQCGFSFVEKNFFEEYRYADHERRVHVRIGNDVWIGAGARIIGGVTVHHGAVILAGAVVTKDVPAYTVVGGVPAKVMRYRFDASTIETLLRFCWWDKSHEWLQKHAEEMRDIEKLKQWIAENE